jgi:hypothetical protein
MTPTVGRIVHFYSANNYEQSNGRGVGPYAAIITGVGGEGPNAMVNLLVFSDAATPQIATSVEGLNLEGYQLSALESPRYWQWPPTPPIPVIDTATVG